MTDLYNTAPCAIVVVAKCPHIGTSKTRLTPFLGDEGSFKLSEALLSDTLVSLSQITSVLKVLLYAPGDELGRQQMIHLLHKLGLEFYVNHPVMDSDTSPWYLMPTGESGDARSLIKSDLGQLLAHGLTRAREMLAELSNHQYGRIGSVLFLGMDAPELRLGEIEYALHLCSANNRRAYMCPSEDGGYGLICVPPDAPACIFKSGVRWSTSLAAISQAKALTDENIDVTFGTMMRDIDVPEDVTKLIGRLRNSDNTDSILGDVLSAFHSDLSIDTSVRPCPLTFSALVELGLIKD